METLPYWVQLLQIGMSILQFNVFPIQDQDILLYVQVDSFDRNNLEEFWKLFT